MGSESDLAVLADGIAKLQDELAQTPDGNDRTELEALLELARETYKVVKARSVKAPRASFRQNNRPGHYLQWH